MRAALVYLVLCAGSASDLTQQVNGYTRQGYRPQGGVAISLAAQRDPYETSGWRNQTTYCQAVTLEGTPEPTVYATPVPTPTERQRRAANLKAAAKSLGGK